MKSKKCKHCEKLIEGYTVNHVDFLMKQHILAKHPDQEVSGNAK